MESSRKVVPVNTIQQRNELERRIELHEAWLASGGAEGERLDLGAAGLAKVDWSGLSLCEVDLREANLHGARLVGADLYGSLLAGAHLDHADLSDANLAKANLDDASLIETSLRGAKLSRATFSRADLRRADLTGAGLLKVLFDNADLRRAILKGDLGNTSLTGARFAGARISGVTGLDSAIVDWIDIGDDEPQRLDGDTAVAWLRARAQDSHDMSAASAEGRSEDPDRSVSKK
jgi:uncharacterized protein YjbI with pentapeptide repeats